MDVRLFIANLEIFNKCGVYSQERNQVFAKCWGTWKWKNFSDVL